MLLVVLVAIDGYLGLYERFVKARQIKKLFAEYPFPLNLKTDNEKTGINNTFADCPVRDEGQDMIDQKPGQQKLDNAQCIITSQDRRGFGIVFEYLFFVHKEVVQRTDQAGDHGP